MPDDIENLVRRLVGGDSTVAPELLDLAKTDNSPILLVAAALVAGAPGDLLTRATASAATTRDRQLVAIATAHLDGDEDRLDGFVRDHLAEHPDNVLVAWIAAQHIDPQR
ncbi:hypothetical protein DFJ67_4950 [Asanoa ferruginea]|uniref:HEAT repeat protein n=1 Tax=Asanoa ferruginea TaxID=53367 RepID=A0A3D9ZNU7_9ACTN|nr:hypothetical protein [Asanoa ferruginea]REF98925.1 hypothetical protein DFJ67_4950 [Asanoa ferruginea]GIF46393.1 hypothetical protein Afe04nite_09320 [Asanoa ferruginea]